MSDLLTVRDENTPCKHGYDIGRCPVDTPVWCPGGKEIVLRDALVGDLYDDGKASAWVWVEEA